MTRTIVTSLAIAVICIGVAAAQPQGAGLGLMGGDPSGLSLKVWTGSRTAFDAGLGYSYFRYGQALHVHGDLLWHTRSMVEDAGNGYLPLYIGIGARLKMADAGRGYPDTRVGVRIPFGVEYVFSVFPVGLFLELVPVFDLTPWNQWLGYNSSIGFRYYFSNSD
jgi:hypothetical protein